MSNFNGCWAILSLVLLLACGPQNPADTSDPKFVSSEHKLLGDSAYLTACAGYPSCPARLLRADQEVDFSYGELVAFSGDFYGKPADLYFEREADGLFKFLSNDIDEVKDFIESDVGVIYEQLSSQELLEFPDRTIKIILAYPQFLGLSLNNIDHFGWHNMKTYVRYHREAIELAMQGFQTQASDPQGSFRLLEQALFVNGFADHFLSDGFATGHIRNPRADTMEWGKREDQAELGVQSLAKLLHDQDHLLSADGAHAGLDVTNARGDLWQTRCDGQLFAFSQLEDLHVSLPREAIKLSLEDVLRAYHQGIMPDGAYAAVSLVPFPSPRAPDLASLFTADVSDAQLQGWIESLGLVSKIKWFTGLDRDLARRYFSSLPEIMGAFRARVTQEAQDPELTLRLPEAYRVGFQNIR